MHKSGILDRYKNIKPNANLSTKEQIKELYRIISDLAVDVEALFEGKTDTLTD